MSDHKGSFILKRLHYYNYIR